MAQIQLVKTSADSLAPANAEAREFLATLKCGVWLNCDIRQQRNYQFHKKLFARVGRQFFRPGEVHFLNARDKSTWH